MADEVLGTARIDVIVGTDQMDVAIERAKSRFSSMSAEAQKAYTGLNAAEKKRIDSLIKQADTIGFTREQQILYNAALKGAPVAILDELKAKMGVASAATAQAAAAARELGKGLKDVSLSDPQLFRVNQSLSTFKDKAEAARIEAGNLGTKLQAVAFDDTKLFRVNQALDTYRAKSLAAAEAADTLQRAQAASAAHAAAAEESARRIAQAKAQETEAVKRGESAVAAALTQQRRLEAMRADAAHAFGPLLAARERETAEMQRSNGVRDRLTAFLSTERGERIAAAEAIRNQGSAYASAAVMAQRSGVAATKAFSGNAKSARELQFAMRGLPAQFTDIFVSLASGQRPMMVLLQQGGQLKDMFGGVGPALRAMGSGILAMINPLTIGVAAAAALAFAWKEGSDEAVAYNKALILTGNYAGVTSNRLADMARELDNVSGVTQHSAAEALAAVVSSGKFTGDAVKQVATAALEMQRTTGQAIDKTIQSFADLAKSPVDGILKLNDAQHFLTESQYEAIKALQDHGREQEAFALAVKVASESVNARTKDVDENLGTLERTLNSVKGAWSEFWDAALDVGRKETPSLKIKQLEQNIQGVQEGHGVYQGLSEDQKTRIIAGMRAKIAQQRQLDFSNVQGGVVGDPVVNSNQKRAQEEWQRAGLKYASDRAKLEHEITEARAAGVKAGASDVEIERRVQEIRDSHAKKGSASSAKEPRSFRVEDMRQIEAEIAAEGKLMDQRQRGEAAVAAYKTTLDDMLQTRQATIDLQVASVGMGQHEIDQMQALIAIDTDYNKKKADLQKRQQSTSDALEKNFYAQQLTDLEAYHDARIRMEKDGARRADEARLSFSAGASSALKDFEYNAGNVAGQTYDVFTNVFDGMADSLAKFVTTGKGNFSDLVESFIADMVKMEARVLASQLLMSIFGGMGTAAGYNSATPSQQVAYDVAHASAKGNVFTSPNLSAYSNTIVDKPTFFAKGGNVMGEAGPEAIMPLRRGPDGRLGVQAAGGSGDVQVEINITNQGQPVQAQQTGQRMDGKKLIIDMAIQAVAADMAKGGMTAQAAQQRFGLSRRGVPVGG